MVRELHHPPLEKLDQPASLVCPVRGLGHFLQPFTPGGACFHLFPSRGGQDELPRLHSLYFSGFFSLVPGVGLYRNEIRAELGYPGESIATDLIWLLEALLPSGSSINLWHHLKGRKD